MAGPTNAVAVVTGAAGGLGVAIAQALISTGRRVVAVDLDEKRLAELVKSFPDGTILPLVADVSNSAAVRAAVGNIPSSFGQPLILVNNAGVTDRSGALDALSDETWHLEFAVHAAAAFYWTRGCFPAMRTCKWGRIVNVSSIAA